MDQPQCEFSPKKSVEDILARNKGESNAGKAAIHLAQYVFFGADLMRRSTAATLDAEKMRQIRDIIVAKYAIKRAYKTKTPCGTNAAKQLAKNAKTYATRSDHIPSSTSFI